MIQQAVMTPGECISLILFLAAVLGLFRWLFDGTSLRLDMQDARMDNLGSRLAWLEDRAVLEIREDDLEDDVPEWPTCNEPAKPCGVQLPAWEPWRY